MWPYCVKRLTPIPCVRCVEVFTEGVGRENVERDDRRVKMHTAESWMDPNQRESSCRPCVFCHLRIFLGAAQKGNDLSREKRLHRCWSHRVKVGIPVRCLCVRVLVVPRACKLEVGDYAC